MAYEPCDGSEVVVRFSPFSVEKLLKNAQDTWVDEQSRGIAEPRYGVSVLAVPCSTDETVEEAVARITNSTSLGGRSVSVMKGSELRANGFNVVKDANAVQPLHYLVGNNPLKELPDAELLASLVDKGRTKNPAWSKDNT